MKSIKRMLLILSCFLVNATPILAGHKEGNGRPRISHPYESVCGAPATNLELAAIIQLRNPGKLLGYTSSSGMRLYFRLDDCGLLPNLHARQ